ncbi:MAG: 2-oxoacid:acceptor oxidoreductase family protein [Candidatus Bathyarchaeia archaeon]
MPKRVEVRICGYGGQGVVLAGQILGKAAVYDGKSALQTQYYGAEARGSLVRSEVIISDSRIGFPAVRKCDILVAMNQESLNKFLKDLKEDGILMVDSTNVETITSTKAETFKIPATEIAEKMFGESTYANMVMLGALTKITKIVTAKSVEKAVKESVSEKTVKDNLNAYKEGYVLRV